MFLFCRPLSLRRYSECRGLPTCISDCCMPLLAKLTPNLGRDLTSSCFFYPQIWSPYTLCGENLSSLKERFSKGYLGALRFDDDDFRALEYGTCFVDIILRACSKNSLPGVSTYPLRMSIEW